jgi:hypothetical protein
MTIGHRLQKSDGVVGRRGHSGKARTLEPTMLQASVTGFCPGALIVRQLGVNKGPFQSAGLHAANDRLLR